MSARCSPSRTTHKRPLGAAGINGLLGSRDPLPPSPPAEKAAACEDQARQTSTSDGARDTGDRDTGRDGEIIKLRNPSISQSRKPCIRSVYCRNGDVCEMRV